MENICVSKTLAQQLQEKGYPQGESLFEFRATDIEEDGLTWWSIVLRNKKETAREKKLRELVGKQPIAAPTASEILGKLPGDLMENIDDVVYGGSPTQLTIIKKDGKFYVFYKNMEEPDCNGEVDSDEDFEPKDNKWEENPAEALGKMALYLLEQGLLEVKKNI